MRGELFQTLVQFLSQRADLLRIPSQFLLVPSIVDGFQQCNQRRWRGWNYLIKYSMLNESCVLFQCGAEERLPWKKHNNELRRGLELLPVLFPGESINVIAHLSSVRVEAGAPHFFIVCFKGVQKRLQGRLRIHHHALT